MIEQVKIIDVMEAYMNGNNLTQGNFADALNASLINTNVSRVTVTSWCNSKSVPSTDTLLRCAALYKDWRRSWAMECLKVKLPEVFDNEMLMVMFRKK